LTDRFPLNPDTSPFVSPRQPLRGSCGLGVTSWLRPRGQRKHVVPLQEMITNTRDWEWSSVRALSLSSSLACLRPWVQPLSTGHAGGVGWIADSLSQAQWHIPVPRRQRQEDCKFETNIVYIVRLCLKQTETNLTNPTEPSRVESLP
jgi:hypothetical protein